MTDWQSNAFYPKSRQEWREWLQQHHQSEQLVWLIYYKQKTGIPSIKYSDAVDEALCFGWIDSTAKTIDEHSWRQFFTRRKPTSVWSKVNKAKVERLITEGLMKDAGFNSIQIAKENGSWTILDEVEELIVPEDLAARLKDYTSAEDYFLGLSNSLRKAILQWLVLAKRPETRQKRIDQIAELASKGQKPPQF